MTPLRTASRALKACSRCKAFDPACGFWHRYRNSDGLDSCCVDCARINQGRARDAAKALDSVGRYREPKRGEFYCRQCDLEMSTAEGLDHHAELRHREA